jgi:2-polyprenyl-6-hydroxyphenyl methylase/3-demethylubiquinone-9 3-methyltransferase
VHAIGPLEPPPGSWWDPAGFWYGLHTLLDSVRIPYFREVLGRGRSASPRLLDIGSGGGFVAAGLGDIARVTGVDRSHAALRDASTAGLGSAIRADAHRLPFGDAVFDVVVCSEVLEHVEDPGSVIAEAARVTIPGGLFLFSTPTRTRLSRLALIEIGQRWWPTRVLPRDLHEWDRFLTPEELEVLFGAAGFAVRRIAGIGIRPRHLPRAVQALVLLRFGLIGYADAGERVELSVVDPPRFAMIGYAELTRQRTR